MRPTFADCDSVEELLGVFAGAASMCWEHPERAGRFESQEASAFVDAALERLIELGWSSGTPEPQRISLVKDQLGWAYTRSGFKPVYRSRKAADPLNVAPKQGDAGG